MAASRNVLVAQEGAPLETARLVEDGLYRIVLRLRAPSAVIPDVNQGPSRDLSLMGRRITVERFRLDSENRTATLDVDIATTTGKAGGDPAPASVSWELIIAGVIAAVGAFFVGPGVAAAVFALGFVIASITRLVRGEPGPGDDVKPGLFGFGVGAVLIVAGVVLFLWKRPA